MIKNCLVVLNYNDSDTTIEFINQIKDYKILDLIVVVDNASTDNSYDKLLKYETKNIKIIRNTENKGYNAGNNVGCRYIIDKYKESNIIISNPDIVVSKETIEKMIDVINSDYNIAICAPWIMQNNAIERGWKISTPLVESLLNLPFIYRILRKNNKNENIRFYSESYYKNEISIVDAVTGCFFIIKSDIIGTFNYFDEKVFLYGEEDILGKQVKELNKKTVIINKYVAMHVHSKTINKTINNINKIKLSNKSKLYFQKEYNHANKFELGILYLSGYIKLINTYIKCLFRR